MSAPQQRRPGARGVKIRAPKRFGLELSAQEMWHRLEDAIGQIQNRDISKLSYEEHYRYAYNLVLQSQGDLLYSGVTDQITSHLTKLCEQSIIPAFPPGGASVPPGIVIPDPPSSSSSSSNRSMNKKGKSRAIDTSSSTSNPDPQNSSSRTQASSGIGGLGVGRGDGRDEVARTQAGERLLMSIRDTWKDHCLCLSKLRDVLKYVDRTYVGSVPNTLPIWDLGLELFKDTVLRSNVYSIHTHFYSTLLSQIQIEREGSVINRSVIKSIIEMLLSLTHLRANTISNNSSNTNSNNSSSGSSSYNNSSSQSNASISHTVYAHDFEPAFLSTSTLFYSSEANRLLDTSDSVTYLKHVEKRFLEENERVSIYLSSTTDLPLKKLMEKHLLEDCLTEIIEKKGSGLSELLDEVKVEGEAFSNFTSSGLSGTERNGQERVQDLARMYLLFGRTSKGHQVLKNGIKKYVIGKGNEINDNVNNATNNAAVELKKAAPLKPKQASENSRAMEEDVPNAASVPPNADGAPPNQASTSTSTPKVNSAKGKGRATASAAVDTNASTPAAATALRWVEEVLDFKAKFDGLLKRAWEDDKLMEGAVNEAFETFVNANPRASEFISLFIDENLKKGLKGKTEDEVDSVLNRTITVYRFLREKDLFESYYKNHLSKRLLQGRSVSDDAEVGMLAKLKIESGHASVQKFQGMLQDMTISRETMVKWNEPSRKAIRNSTLDLQVNVLTATHWPLSSPAPLCEMPPVIMAARAQFEQFYNTEHSGRILKWHPEIGTADIKVAFKTRKHDLNVSTYAMCVLTLFEGLPDEGQDSYLSLSQIKTRTSIADTELKRTLQSLACGKYKILNKEPKSKEVGDSDRFNFNSNFTCPLARIKINQVAARVESQEEKKETNVKLEEDRKNQVEACIVRIMKDRKTLSHEELLNEVIRQIGDRFRPEPVFVKKRIESLIDREYLERAETKNVYNYSA